MAIEEQEEPPPELRYRRVLHLRTEIKELIQARHVIYSLSERDLRSCYSQMALGFLWNVLGPLALTFVIALLLTKAKVAAPLNVPKPIWIYTALMPWTFFSGAVGSGGTSLVSNNALLNKVYVPRRSVPDVPDRRAGRRLDLFGDGVHRAPVPQPLQPDVVDDLLGPAPLHHRARADHRGHGAPFRPHRLLPRPAPGHPRALATRALLQSHRLGPVDALAAPAAPLRRDQPPRRCHRRPTAVHALRPARRTSG